jgi:hypothetical protein
LHPTLSVQEAGYAAGLHLWSCRQLEAVVGHALERVWAFGAGPGSRRLVVDVDSTVCEMAGKAKAEAAFGYTRALGYPILVTRGDTGEICHARIRKGSANTARGAGRFVQEQVARLRRAGAAGEMVMRVNSGFWAKVTIATLGRLDVRYTMAVRTNNKALAAVIAAMDREGWGRHRLHPRGRGPGGRRIYGGRPLIVRRTQLTNAAQARLWPDWRHFGFLTDLAGEAVAVDAFHRDHATVELAIRDPKEGAGMEHVPSGDFSANSAWCSARSWPTTSSAGRPPSANPGPSTVSPLPGCCASGLSTFRAGWSTGPAPSPCQGRPDGRGPPGSAVVSSGCGLCSQHPGSAHQAARRTATETSV